MYKAVEKRFQKALREHIYKRYKVEVPVVTERPQKLAMGESASPVCFELAKRLKKAPRALAQEIANSLPAIEGISRVEVAGGGYLNAFFDRAEFFMEPAESPLAKPAKRTAGRRPRHNQTPQKSSSSIPASIQTRPHTLGICVMLCSATRLPASCATSVGASKFKITSTIRAFR